MSLRQTDIKNLLLVWPSISIDHKFSTPFKSYLGKDAVYNLKRYDDCLITEELGKFRLKTNVIPNVLERHMTFIISNKFIFIASFQFLSSSLDSFVKNLSKNDFKSLSQEFDINVLDLVKQKSFYPYECICDFE